ncbi:MAG: ketose-bisphosphate aldolase, partial [Polyangia bacterium]
MPLVSMRQLLDHAAEHGYGIPAFNVNNLEQVQAVMTAADEVGAPVILQASAGARKYAGEAFIKHLISAAIESWPKVPLVMHQDHGQSPDVCKSAIELGFSSVMMDGSLEEDGKSIASYDYNVGVTKKVVDMAHARGVTVEGELGCLGSLETMRGDKEDGHGSEATMTREQLLTDPEQAADFVKRTQLDALAIAIGTSHGAYKFTRKVVDMAHKLGVTVEGELGCLGSLETMKGDKEDGHGTEATMTREQLLTDPEQAADFVKKTQLDALAIA